ncbi:transcriptional regulator [Streptomyces sp. NPDC088354]|uniref:MmyB family transcriptional regulator n=1 Tax=Streptomyces sp. NPDC088354 TaxID=3365856 RepID=UPI0037F2C14A
MAFLLRRTERWYAQLERGDLEPTSDMLDKVAGVLQMSEQERTAMYIFALGYEPPVPLDPAAGCSINSSWAKVVHSITGHACYIHDVGWNLLAANDLFVRMFPREPGKPARAPRNLMEWMLLDPRAREDHLIDWPTRWAPQVAAQLRAAVAAHPENETLRLLDKQVHADAVAGPIYRRCDLAYVHADGDTRPMRHWAYPEPQSGQVTMCVAEPFSSPGVRFFILMFDPDDADGQTPSFRDAES